MSYDRVGVRAAPPSGGTHAGASDLDPDDDEHLSEMDVESGSMTGEPTVRNREDCNLCLPTTTFASQKAKIVILALACGLMAAVAYIAMLHSGAAAIVQPVASSSNTPTIPSYTLPVETGAGSSHAHSQGSSSHATHIVSGAGAAAGSHVTSTTQPHGVTHTVVKTPPWIKKPVTAGAQAEPEPAVTIVAPTSPVPVYPRFVGSAYPSQPDERFPELASQLSRRLAEFDPAFPSAHKGGVAVIGSSGYIGSRLLSSLRAAKTARSIGFDRIHSGRSSEDISTEVLQSFDVVVFLGGFTGRVMCNDRPEMIDAENVEAVVNVAKRMLPSQTLLFASTSALAEGYGATPMKESDPLRTEGYDLYVASMHRREQALSALSKQAGVPKMAGLRFGTVLGLSDSQRTDFVHLAMTCSAFSSGRISMGHPESHRAVVWMEDLQAALLKIIEQVAILPQYDVFHLASFGTTVGAVANAVAARTSAPVAAADHPVEKDSVGFNLDTSKARTTFGIEFKGTQDKILQQMSDDVPRMCVGRASRVAHDSVPCVVCGHKHMIDALELHTQPLANDFRTTAAEAAKCERFPLKLVRCPRCFHSQLSHIVDRGYLFSHYLYASGTSASLQVHFSHLAEKIISESPHPAGSPGQGTILEIASNDGSQLDQFKKRGWRTYGVDPAANIAEVATAKGHTIRVGFWSVDKFELPPPDELDAIVAQNVFAHVTDPTEFLRAAFRAMGPQTKLYLQTSQCEMYESGQFDTVYHEHVSFFTAHSFRYAAALTGLKVIAFQIVPIHGNSCLVTMQKRPGLTEPTPAENMADLDLAPPTMATVAEGSVAPSYETAAERLAGDANAFHLAQDSDEALALEAPTFAAILRKERDMGLTTDWFYVKYEAQAKDMRDWLVRHMVQLQADGHTLVGYAAAAKGMVLLHFMLELQANWKLNYVVDDAELKQNTFCPGTDIPVKPTSALSAHDPSKPLTVLVFAWNFWEEIAKRIVAAVSKNGMKEVFVVVPFPVQIFAKMDVEGKITILERNSFRALSWPNPLPPEPRKKTVLVGHFHNEEWLLPFFIRHHAPHFDHVTLINYASTDNSMAIIARDAPSNWKVVQSRNQQFIAEHVDAEVTDYENEYPDQWRMSLNTPEFLVHADLRSYLAGKERAIYANPKSLNTGYGVPASTEENSWGYRFPAYHVVGSDAEPLGRFSSLVAQRRVVAMSDPGGGQAHGGEYYPDGVCSYARYVHAEQSTYHLGRHGIHTPWMWADQGYIHKLQWSPWPEIRDRKLHVKDLIPRSEFQAGKGYQHDVNQEQLDQQHAAWVDTTSKADLSSIHEAHDSPTFKQVARNMREHIATHHH